MSKSYLSKIISFSKPILLSTVLLLTLLQLVKLPKQAYAIPQEESGNWIVETLDTCVSGKPQIAIDTEGRIHVMGYSDSNLDEIYAIKENGGWHTETITTVVGIQNFVLDDNNYPHAAFNSGGTIYYATRDDLGWEFQAVESSAQAGVPYLALGSNEVPHLVYKWENIDFPPSRLRYATSDTLNSWYTIFMTDVVDVNSAHIIVDSADNPHILYHTGSSLANPNHLYWDGLVWNSEEFHHYDSFVLDENDKFHISYSINDGTIHARGDIEYGKFESNTWVTETVANNNQFFLPSLVLDDNSKPHIGYSYDAFGLGQSLLKYAYLDVTGWHTDTVDSGVFMEDDGFSKSSIAIDANGVPHLVYIYKPATGCSELRYAFKGPEQIFLPMIVKP